MVTKAADCLLDGSYLIRLKAGLLWVPHCSLKLHLAVWQLQQVVLVLTEDYLVHRQQNRQLTMAVEPSKLSSGTQRLAVRQLEKVPLLELKYQRFPSQQNVDKTNIKFYRYRVMLIHTYYNYTVVQTSLPF